MIGAGQSVAEETRFPDGSLFKYELCTTDEGDRCDAGQQSSDGVHIMQIKIPVGLASEWSGSDEVGLTGESAIQLGPLSVLIEKDFTCITPREGEEELDTYPNPNNPPAVERR